MQLPQILAPDVFQHEDKTFRKAIFREVTMWKQDMRMDKGQHPLTLITSQDTAKIDLAT